MKTFIKHVVAFLLVCMSARVSANEIWVPGTSAGARLEYVTLNTNVIDTLAPWSGKQTRIEYGFESDTTTYFILPVHFEGVYWERGMELYQTLRDALFNKIFVNVQMDSATLDFLQIRLGVTDHPLAIGQRIGNGGLGAEGRLQRIDLLGRNRNMAPGLSWQRIVPARR